MQQILVVLLIFFNAAASAFFISMKDLCWHPGILVFSARCVGLGYV